MAMRLMGRYGVLDAMDVTRTSQEDQLSHILKVSAVRNKIEAAEMEWARGTVPMDVSARPNAQSMSLEEKVQMLQARFNELRRIDVSTLIPARQGGFRSIIVI